MEAQRFEKMYGNMAARAAAAESVQTDLKYQIGQVQAQLDMATAGLGVPSMVSRGAAATDGAEVRLQFESVYEQVLSVLSVC